MNLFRRELAGRRHLKRGFGVPDGLDQEALLNIAGHDCRRARTAAFEHAFPSVEQQTTLRAADLCAVAAVAIGREDRSNLLLEELNSIRRLISDWRRGSVRGKNRQPAEGDCHQSFENGLHVSLGRNYIQSSSMRQTGMREEVLTRAIPARAGRDKTLARQPSSMHVHFAM